ncbi:MAG: hypothetical protein EOP42_28840 [Sphingobacteriaceae bacterium]|nr:MAG: hypothetical protein EOP42_28840 [Sphingobacteriaceae bacterium]
MANQDSEQYKNTNDTHESTSKTDRPISVGENEENHTSGNSYDYQKKGKDSQSETGGEDGKKVHTDNNAGNSTED